MSKVTNNDGVLTLKIPSDLKARMSDRAWERRVSLSEYVRQLAQADLGPSLATGHPGIVVGYDFRGEGATDGN